MTPSPTEPMWLLWAVAVAMLVLALAGLLWPLLHDPAEPVAPDDDAQARLRELYRAQRDELERDVAHHALAPADRALALDELQRRLLHAFDRTPTAPDAAPRTRRWQRQAPAVVLTLALPLGALALYLQAGDPRAAALLAQVQQDTHEAAGQDIDAMVERLAARLQHQPEDLEGWMVLARSREMQEDFDTASQAYRRAIALADGRDAPPALRARMRADLADALASSRDGALDGPVQDALDQALALDPEQPKALALAGSAAWRGGDRDAARRHWTRLLGLLAPDSDIALRVRSDLARLDEGDAQPMAAPMAAPAAPAAITGTVLLAPSVRARVEPTDTVFIVARARGAGPMPVAVLRLRADRLPTTFVLDERTAMSPERPMSAFDEFDVEAWVSRSGSARHEAGQPASASRLLRLGSHDAALLIDRADPSVSPGQRDPETSTRDSR